MYENYKQLWNFFLVIWWKSLQKISAIFSMWQPFSFLLGIKLHFYFSDLEFLSFRFEMIDDNFTVFVFHDSVYQTFRETIRVRNIILFCLIQQRQRFITKISVVKSLKTQNRHFSIFKTKVVMATKMDKRLLRSITYYYIISND